MHSIVQTYEIIKKAKRRIDSCEIGLMCTPRNKSNTIIKNVHYLNKIFGDIIDSEFNKSKKLEDYWLNSNFELGHVEFISDVGKDSILKVRSLIENKKHWKQLDKCKCGKSYYVVDGKCNKCGVKRTERG